MTNYIQMKIDYMLQNRKCRLCDDKDETIHHIIHGYRKWAQKEYKTRYNWMGKLKFDPTTKKYMHKPESVLENEMHKILWDFKVQTDHQT